MSETGMNGKLKLRFLFPNEMNQISSKLFVLDFGIFYPEFS